MAIGAPEQGLGRDVACVMVPVISRAYDGVDTSAITIVMAASSGPSALTLPATERDISDSTGG